MGLASRPARAAATVVAAVPLLAASVFLSGPAAARPAQTKDGEVTTTAALRFDPPTITVAAGTKVTWTNGDGAFHTVTGGDAGTKDDASPIDGQLPAKDNTYSVTFDKPGTYSYFCAPHASSGMTGEVVVTAAGKGTGGKPTAKATTAAPTTAAPTASPSASTGTEANGAGAPTAEPGEGEEDAIPGVAGNPTLERIETERAAEHGAVSGFRFFTIVACAFLVILGAAVLFSTRPRRAGR